MTEQKISNVLITYIYMYGMDKEIDTKDVYGLICPIDCKFCDEFDN